MISNPGKSISPGGVVNAASFASSTAIAPGSWIAIYGSNLADQTVPGFQVPKGNETVQLYTSGSQINLQVPYSTPINAQLQLLVEHDSMLSPPFTIGIIGSVGVYNPALSGTGYTPLFYSTGGGTQVNGLQLPNQGLKVRVLDNGGATLNTQSTILGSVGLLDSAFLATHSLLTFASRTLRVSLSS